MTVFGHAMRDLYNKSDAWLLRLPNDVEKALMASKTSSSIKASFNPIPHAQGRGIAEPSEAVVVVEEDDFLEKTLRCSLLFLLFGCSSFRVTFNFFIASALMVLLHTVPFNLACCPFLRVDHEGGKKCG